VRVSQRYETAQGLDQLAREISHQNKLPRVPQDFTSGIDVLDILSQKTTRKHTDKYNLLCNMAKSDLCAPAFIFLFYADVCQTRKAKQAEQQSSQLGEELSSTIL